jgi:hypothetical protein
MFGQSAKKLPESHSYFGSGDRQPSMGDRKHTGVSVFRRDVEAARVGGARARSRFLSEGEAARYLGMSAEQLASLRECDLALIGEGLKPHGPPPLWCGEVCSYASENLDEWVCSQPIETRSMQRPNGHEEQKRLLVGSGWRLLVGSG